MVRIAIFGQPGSGKSTIAKELSKVSNFDVIELSREIIYPLAANIKKMNSKKKIFQFFKYDKHNISKAIMNREKARNIKKALKKYSSNIIFEIIQEKYVNIEKPKNLIFSGFRGLENAKNCRLNNYFVVYLKTDKKILINRLKKDRKLTKQEAEEELNKEELNFKTKKIDNVANLIIDTSKQNIKQSVEKIWFKFKEENKMCIRCVNTAKNPSISFDKKGLCNICSNYKKNFDKKHLKKELEFLESFDEKDLMVGISGGKDSTATLHTIKQMGFKPLAFTFNTGYLPKTTIPRARQTAKDLGIEFESIDIRKYLKKRDIESYRRTIAFYEKPFSLETKQEFKEKYKINREHYSIKCNHSLAFVRSCQLCRKMVIRAYYGEATKRNAKAIILGINEWTNLSSAQNGKKFKVSGIRKLQPNKNEAPIYVFHLPFILQRKIKDTKKILKKLKWKAPINEDLIESNSNSCLFARSTERMAKRMLEFHPDSTRLAREVTVGFISKKQALKALGKIHPYKFTPRQVLKKAKII